MYCSSQEFIPNTIKDDECFKTINIRQPNILRKAAQYFLDNYKVYLKKKFTKLLLSDEQIVEADADAKRIYEEIMNYANRPPNNDFLTKIEDNYEDVDLWNSRLKEYVELNQKLPDYLNTSLLWTECFIYRSLASAFFKSKYFQDFDSFEMIKKNGFLNSHVESTKLIEYTANIANRLFKEKNSSCEKEFENSICFALFGNRFDLSNSYGTVSIDQNQIVDHIEKEKSKIVSNSIKEVYEYFKTLPNKVTKITIVLDNSGFELLGDLCFIEMLYQNGLIDEKSKIIFHVKKFPWFVSDVTERDFKWLLECLFCQFKSDTVKNMAVKWYNLLIKTKNWELRSHKFWTTSWAFDEMQSKAPDLYTELSDSNLIIFKGDLNYRKLIRDHVWDLSTPFKVALHNFFPTNILALRTIKCRPVVAIDKDIQLPENYWAEGEYGVIQFYKKD